MSNQRPNQTEVSFLDKVRSIVTLRTVGLVGGTALVGSALTTSLTSSVDHSPNRADILCSGHRLYPVNPGESFDDVMTQVTDDIKERTGVTPASMFINTALYDALKQRGLSWEHYDAGSLRPKYEVPEGVTSIVGPEKCDPLPQAGS